MFPPHEGYHICSVDKDANEQFGKIEGQKAAKRQKKRKIPWLGHFMGSELTSNGGYNSCRFITEKFPGMGQIFLGVVMNDNGDTFGLGPNHPDYSLRYFLY